MYIFFMYKYVYSWEYCPMYKEINCYYKSSVSVSYFFLNFKSLAVHYIYFDKLCVMSSLLA